MPEKRRPSSPSFEDAFTAHNLHPAVDDGWQGSVAGLALRQV
jgi:hypothetical protein